MKNMVILTGNLGENPEIRYTKSGTPVCNMRIATNEFWTDKNGAKKEHTEWHRIVVWGKNAENCGKYLTKGRLVDVTGKLRTRKWEDRDGNTRYTTEIVADRVLFLPGGKRQEAVQTVDGQVDDSVPVAKVEQTSPSEDAQKIFASEDSVLF